MSSSLIVINSKPLPLPYLEAVMFFLFTSFFPLTEKLSLSKVNILVPPYLKISDLKKGNYDLSTDYHTHMAVVFQDPEWEMGEVIIITIVPRSASV